MLKLVVIDRSAESRLRLVESLHTLLGRGLPHPALIPRVSIEPRAPHEVRFHGAPDICIFGRDIVQSALEECGELRRLMPSAVAIAELGVPPDDLVFIERLARLGIDDVIPPECSPGQLLQRLLFALRGRRESKRGQIILVEGGKGGLGVTSIAAALTDRAASFGKAAVLIDLDTETQDAARFLQARPFLNEMLQELFEQHRPVTQEFVEQCLVPPANGEASYRVIPPLPYPANFDRSPAEAARFLADLLEVLDQIADVTIIDSGCLRGEALETLEGLADVAVLVVSTDPAALHTSLERARRIQSRLSSTAKLVIALNRDRRRGLAPRFVLREVSRAAGLPENRISSLVIPPCTRGALWPGSGETLSTAGGRAVTYAIKDLWERIDRGAPVAPVSRYDARSIAADVAEHIRLFYGKLVPWRLARGRSTVTAHQAARTDETPRLIDAPSPRPPPLLIDPRSLVSGLNQRLEPLTEA